MGGEGTEGTEEFILFLFPPFSNSYPSFALHSNSFCGNKKGGYESVFLINSLGSELALPLSGKSVIEGEGNSRCESKTKIGVVSKSGIES